MNSTYVDSSIQYGEINDSKASTPAEPGKSMHAGIIYPKSAATETTSQQPGNDNKNWNSYWIAKYTEAIKKQGPVEKFHVWVDFIKKYLEQNPYPPARIFVQRMESFLEDIENDKRTEAARSLYFFYQHACFSVPHLTAAEAIGRRSLAYNQGNATTDSAAIDKSRSDFDLGYEHQGIFHWMSVWFSLLGNTFQRITILNTCLRG